MDKLLFILSQKLAVLLVVSATGFGALITNTTATIPAGNSNTVFPAKDLKPFSSSRLRKWDSDMTIYSS